MSYFPTVKISAADSPSSDAFGRLRISNPHTLFDSKTIRDKNSLLWDEDVKATATSTFNKADACCNITVTNSGDYAIRQTKMCFTYQPGKSMLVLLTAAKFQAQTNVVKSLGYLTGQFPDPHSITDGVYFSSADGYIGVNVAKGGAVNCVAQSNWNLDKMDGTGPSGFNIDWSLTQIFVIDFQWLGVGRVRFGLELNGVLYYVHQFNHANAKDSVYMSSSNLHCRYEVRSTGGAGSLDTICTAVISEGGQEENGVIRTHSNGPTFVTCSSAGQGYAVIGIKLGAADGYQDINIKLLNLSLLAETPDNYRWMLCFNPTLSSPLTYTSSIPESAVLGAIGPQTVIDPGIIVHEGYGQGGAQLQIDNVPNAIRLGHTIDGQMDDMVLVVTGLSAALHINASLTWREL